MKRLIAALVAALLIAGLLPASTLAIPYSGVQDQANETHVGGYNSSPNLLAQTFTAAQSGTINRIDLYLISLAGNTLPVEVTAADGTSHVGWSDQETVGTSYGWVSFFFSHPAPIKSGTQYAIVIDGSQITDIGYSSDLYAGGAALVDSGSGFVAPGVAGVQDFTFRTWVSPQTTTLAWDKSQLTAGQTASLQLTETIVFPQWSGAEPSVARPNAGVDVTWAVNAVALPAWFTPSQIACSAHILPADCTIANATGTGTTPVDTGDGPITITLTGTVAPTAANVGNANASASGCATYAFPTRNVCVTGTAGIQVVAAPAPPTPTPAPPTQQPAPATPSPTPHVTLPPTSANETPQRPGGSPMALLVLLMALAAVGSVASLALRRR